MIGKEMILSLQYKKGQMTFAWLQITVLTIVQAVKRYDITLNLCYKVA